MAGVVPAPLKSADVARFAHRAGQLEKAKPVVAYYCYYWIVDQIIAKGLHQTDRESMAYTTSMMDKLEQMKTDYSETDAISDDVAGHAYIEQFGMETFQRAENAMKANKATRQTADTFQAAATFLELCHIWDPLEPEIASKIKFAKYHALRIAKAIKAGEDPNATNPVQEPPPSVEVPLDPDDPEVQMINGTAEQPHQSQRASVEDVPDESNQPGPTTWNQTSSFANNTAPAQDPRVPPSVNTSWNHLNQPPSPPEAGDTFYSKDTVPDVSPLAPPDNDRKSSLGGGYFPSVPDGVGQGQPHPPSNMPRDFTAAPPNNLPQPPSFHPAAQLPPFTDPSQRPDISSFHSFPAPAMSPANGMTSPDAPRVITPPSQPPAPIPRQAPIPQHVPTYQAPPPQPMPVTSVQRSHSDADLKSDEESIAAAQKHARWAISALNFEDVKTAVKELRGALESLGAS